MPLFVTPFHNPSRTGTLFRTLRMLKLAAFGRSVDLVCHLGAAIHDRFPRSNSEAVHCASFISAGIGRPSISLMHERATSGAELAVSAASVPLYLPESLVDEGRHFEPRSKVASFIPIGRCLFY